MGDLSTLKAAVQAAIRTNGNQEITGQVLQNTLTSIINTLGTGAQYMGIATPSTNPGTPDAKVFYIASANGTYSNFGGITVNNEVVILVNSSGSWVKQTTGFATIDGLNNVINQIGTLSNLQTTTKTNLVAAINEVLLTFNTEIGNLSSLTTEEKTNLVAAINELVLNLDTLVSEIYGETTTIDKTFSIPSIGASGLATNKQTINLISGKHYSVSCSEALSSGYLYFYADMSSSSEIERVSISTLLTNGYTPSQNVGAITIYYNNSAMTTHNVVFAFSVGGNEGLKEKVSTLRQDLTATEQSLLVMNNRLADTENKVETITETDQQGGYNLFNPSDEKLWNGYIKSDGSISESTPYDGTATYFTTGYITVEVGKTYYNAPTDKSYYGSRFLMYYDADKSPIVSSYNSTDRTVSSVAPTNAKYLRVSIATRYFNECQITEGQQREYAPYIEPSSQVVIKGERIKAKSIGKNALSDDIDFGGRNKMYIYLSDSEEEIFLKLRQAIEQKDTDVYWEKGTYTFSSIFDLMATKYAPMQSYELPVGGNCRYYFNGATLRGIYSVGSDFDDVSRNLMGSAREASDYELHDGFLYAEGLRYVFHDETNGSAVQYRRLYHNMHFSRKWAKPNVSTALEKIIGGGTGEWGIVEFDGCTFKADSRAKQFVTYHGVTKNTTEYSRFECVIKNCYIDGVLNFYDAAGYSTNQHWLLVICNNAINTIGRSSFNEKFDVVEFGNEVIQ